MTCPDGPPAGTSSGREAVRGRRRGGPSGLALVLFVIGGLVVLAGCGSRDPSPVVALVHVPPEERGKLSLSPGVGEPERVEAAREEGPKGREAFANQEDVRRFETECELLQPDAARGEGAGGGEDAGGGEGRGSGEGAGGAGGAGGGESVGDRGSFGAVWRGTEPAPDLGPPPEDGTFVWVEGDPEYLDPNLIAETSGTNIASQMFEGLLAWAAGNRPPEPGMAERYEVSEDGRTYTFHLRDGLVWSDGTPLGAEDFRYGWLRGLDPKTGSKNAQQLWVIEGARAFNSGEAKGPEGVGIEVVDARTLRVTLESPAPYFPDLVAYIAYAPVPRHAVERHGIQWTRPDHIVVNGPYRLAEEHPRDRIVLAKNPRYWNAANVAIPKVVFLMSDDEQKGVRFYESGQAHYVLPLPEARVPEWVRSGRSDLRIDAIACTYYYVFRTDRPPFDDPLVRRAFNQAIDKERLARHVLGSMQVPAANLITPIFTAMMGYEPVPGAPFDPKAAKALLAEAGYPGGVGLPPVEVLYNTYESHRVIAEYVQRSWKDALGVPVSVNNMEWRSLLKRAHAGDFQVLRASWCADYPDPMTFLSVFHSEGENNYAAYRNPAYDDLLRRIGRERDRRRRNVLLCAAEKTLNRDVPLVPFYFYTRSYFLRPFVQGFEPQYQDHHLVKHLRIETGKARAD